MMFEADFDCCCCYYASSFDDNDWPFDIGDADNDGMSFPVQRDASDRLLARLDCYYGP